VNIPKQDSISSTNSSNINEEPDLENMSFDGIKEDIVKNKILGDIRQHKTQVFAICLPADKIYLNRACNIKR